MTGQAPTLVATLVLFVALASAAPARQAATTAEIAARADAYFTALNASQRFNGAILLARDGKVIIKKGYGKANFEWDIPNTPSTKFRIGSITKQFTSMAIMQLEAAGRLSVDDPISKHLTDYPKPVADRVTIQHLLTHSSGIPSYTEPADYGTQMTLPFTVAQMIARFKDKPLEFEPGSRFKYDNSGYFLLGAIIEKVSGETYEAYLRDHIFGRLGMADSGYDRSNVILKNRAAGYGMRPTGLENAPYLDMGQPYAAGSLYSTVEDLLRWDQALYTTTLVPQASLDRIFKPWIAAGAMGSYGYGWGISTVKGHRAIWHNGGINGFNTYISRFPDDHAVFIWLCNVTGPTVMTLNQDVTGILFGEKIEPPR